MIEALRNAWRMPDLRRRILFTMAALVVYRLGSHVFIPGIDRVALEALWDRISQNFGALAVVNVFSGSNLATMTVFALGIMPYISASIILQLLTVVIPQLEQLSKEGPSGRRKINQYTRYGTIGLSAFNSIVIIVALERPSTFGFDQQVILNPGFGFYFMTMLTLTAGTTFVMWLGEQIEEYGIGQGISLIIYAGIVAETPAGISSIIFYMQNQESGTALISVLAIVGAALLIVMGTIFVTLAERRIPVQYSKRVVGRRQFGGQTQYLPLKVNTAGVMPIIFAITIMQFPNTFINLPIFSDGVRQVMQQIFSPGATYNLVYGLLIVFFTYFYTAVIINPVDIADNLKRYGGFIPGVRPGRQTARYLDRTLSRITLPGAIFLAAIAIIPLWIVQVLTKNALFLSGIGGTSILIVVGVALDRMQWLDAQLRTKNYDGLMKGLRHGGKMRGRRR